MGSFISTGLLPVCKVLLMFYSSAVKPIVADPGSAFRVTFRHYKFASYDPVKF